MKPKEQILISISILKEEIKTLKEELNNTVLLDDYHDKNHRLGILIGRVQGMQYVLKK